VQVEPGLAQKRQLKPQLGECVCHQASLERLVRDGAARAEERRLPLVLRDKGIEQVVDKCAIHMRYFLGRYI
jgi:hypothetical protein